MQDWIIPCNPKFYNVEGAFSKLKRINWKQSSPNICVGDEIYIYVAKPIMAIKYKCRVTKVNLDSIEIDDREFVVNGDPYITYPVHMELELVRQYEDELTMDILKQYGIKGSIQSPRKLNKELESYILSIQ